MEQCPNCQREITADSKRLGYCEFCGFLIVDKPTPPFPLSLQRALTSEEQEKVPDAAPTLLPTARKKKRLIDLGSQLKRLSPGKHISHKLQSGADAADQVAEETELSAETPAEPEEPTSVDDALAVPEVQAPIKDSVTLTVTKYETFDDEVNAPEDEAAAPELGNATPPRETEPPTPAPTIFVAPESAARVEPTSQPAPSGPFTAPTTSPYPLPPAPPPCQMPAATYATPGFPATNAPIIETSQPMAPVQPESGQSRSGEYNPLPTSPSVPIYSGPGMVQSYPQSDAYMRAAPVYPTPNVTVFLPPGALPQSVPTPMPARARRTGRGFFAGCLTAIIVIVAAGVGAVTWGLKNGYSIPVILAPATATQTLGTTVPTVPAGFTTFVAPDSDYSLIYPVNWQQSSAVATGDAVTTQRFISPDMAYQVLLSEQSSLLGSGEYAAFFTTYLQPFALSNLQMATATQPVVIGANQWLMLSATGTYQTIDYTLQLYGVNHDNHTIIFVTMTPTAAETIADGQFFQPMLRSLQLVG